MAVVGIPYKAAAAPVTNLVWEDTFSGSSIDSSIWAPMSGETFNYGFKADGSIQGEGFANLNSTNLADATYYDVSAGTLKLHGIKGSYPVSDGHRLTTAGPQNAAAPWKSGNITSRHTTQVPGQPAGTTYSWGYGQRLESRINCQLSTVGMRPSLCTFDVGGYPGALGSDGDGEVDILEWFVKLGQNNWNMIWAYSSTTGGPSGPRQNVLSAPANNTSYGGFHTYACEWGDDFKFYKDGVLIRTVTAWASAFNTTAGALPPFPHPFQPGVKHTVRIVNQIGGRYSSYLWDGSTGSINNPPVDPAISSITLEVDYVRVTSL